VGPCYGALARTRLRTSRLAAERLLRGSGGLASLARLFRREAAFERIHQIDDILAGWRWRCDPHGKLPCLLLFEQRHELRAVAIFQQRGIEVLGLRFEYVLRDAKHLVGKLKFKDEYENALKKLVRRKAAGKPIEVAEEAREESNVVNLMDALRQSVGKRASRPKSAKPRGRTKKTKRRKAA
jgi:hypothetical protein